MSFWDIILNIFIVIIVALITGWLLYAIYKKIQKHPPKKEILKKHEGTYEKFLICAGTIIVVVGTFVLDSILKLIFKKQIIISNVLSTGIFIIISMLLLGRTFEFFYKKIYGPDYNKSYKNLILINYIVACIIVILLSFIYIKDCTLALTWIVILLGKFMWFDGIFIDIKIPLLKESIIMIFIDLLFSGILLLSLYVFENTYWNILLFVYAGIDFGMFAAGIIIVIREKKMKRI